MTKKRWMLPLGAVVLVAAARQSFSQTAATALASLGSDSVHERRAAAAALASLGAPGLDSVEAIAQQLGELRRSVGGGLASVMNELPLRGGDGTQARADRDPHSNEVDVVDLLVQRKPDRAVERALATICLMRALARLGTTPAIRQLVLTASDAGGAFRPELSRELKQLDERATAALIEAQGDHSFEMRTWAKNALEALGKRSPGDSVQTTNDQVLVDVLHAYAAIRDLDALPVLVSFVNSGRTHVREAAREATLAFGPDAVGKLRTTYAAVTGERLADAADEAEVASKLFDAYDRIRLRDVYERLDQGLAKQRAGDIDGAIADFDNVLAREPVLHRSAETVPAYLAYSEWIEPTDRARSLEYLRKALRLDGTSLVASGSSHETDATAESTHIQSEIQYLQGEELIARGIADTSPFERALELDPNNAHARARLDRLRTTASWGRVREDRIAAAVATAGVSLVTLGLFALSAPRDRVGSKRRSRQ